MTEEQRSVRIYEIIWNWLPVRWTDGVDWWEIKNVEVIGSLEEGGASLTVQKNIEPVYIILFTNNELYGEIILSSNAAKDRIMGYE